MAKKKESEKKKTALAKRDEDVPSYLSPVPEGEILPGQENVRARDILIPRLVLLQALSPAVVEGDNQAGEILNSISEEIEIDKDAEKEFIPIYHYLEWIQWNDRDQGGGIQDRSLDPDGQLAQMSNKMEKHTTNEGKEVFTVTEYHNFVCIFVGEDKPELIVISCAKSNIKHAKKFLGLIRMRGRYPMYAGKYTVKAVLETNQQNQKYYTYKFLNAGWAEEGSISELGKMYVMMRDAFKDRRLLSHQLEEEREAAESETEM
jgi:hypothetical protein